MKTTLRHKLAVILTTACAAALTAAPLTASAASITIKDSASTNVKATDKSFKAYKIMDIVKDNDGTEDIFTPSVTNAAIQQYFVNKLPGLSALKTAETLDLTDAAVILKINEEVGKYLGTLKGSDTVAFAREILAAAKTAGITPVDSAKNQFADIAVGYYVIEDVSENADAYSTVILQPVQTAGDALNIALKTDKPDVVKKIVEGTDRVDANTASVGDYVDYELASKVPDATYFNKYTFQITDHFSDGLTFDTTDADEDGVYDNLAVAIEAFDHPIFYHASYDETTRDLTIDFNAVQMKWLGTADDAETEAVEGYGLAGAKITVTYRAQVNEDAEIGTAGNPNEVFLTYSNNPNQSGTPYTETEPPTDDDDDDDEPDDEDEDDNDTNDTPKDIVKTYVTKIKVAKIDQYGNALPGAKFSISGSGVQKTVKTETAADGKTLTVTTDAEMGADALEAEVDENGYLVFSGIGEGSYVISETQAPEGYNPLNEGIAVEISCTVPAEITDGTEECTWSCSAKGATSESEYVNAAPAGDPTFTIQVVNKKGALFPSTGGTGTLVLILLGVTLFGGAAGLIVLRKKITSK